MMIASGDGCDDTHCCHDYDSREDTGTSSCDVTIAAVVVGGVALDVVVVVVVVVSSRCVCRRTGWCDSFAGMC